MNQKRRLERMATDPAFRKRIHDTQVASRRRRRLREWLSVPNRCQHFYADGRRCWKMDNHAHPTRIERTRAMVSAKIALDASGEAPA